MQGELTDQTKIARFMKDLLANGGHGELTGICNYDRDGTPMRVSLITTPLFDGIGGGILDKSEAAAAAATEKITHIGVTVTEMTKNPPEFSSCSDVILSRVEDERDWCMEVGLELDRRDNCNMYSKRGDIRAPSGATEWAALLKPSLSQGGHEEPFPFALMLRYMLRSTAAIALIDHR